MGEMAPIPGEYESAALNDARNDSNALKRRATTLEARVDRLEVNVVELIKLVEKLRKKHNKKAKAKLTAEDEMWARRRREDVMADPGAAY